MRKGTLGSGGMAAVCRVVGLALVLLAGALSLFASGAQASRLHGGRPAVRWGGFTSRGLRADQARPGRRAAAVPAVAGTGSIEGAVRDAAKGTGIVGIEVCAFTFGSFEEEEEEEGGLHCALTIAGGYYAINRLPAGEYIVEFSTPFNGTLDYITQYWEEAKTLEESFPVEVATGQRVGGIDASLSKGGEVEGHVTGARGGSLADIEVCAWGVISDATACARTNSSGTYLITGLPTGSFKVGFRPEPESGLNYITQFYDEETSYASADPIDVKAEQKKEDVDAALAVGAEIEGTVTSGETGGPSSFTPVCAIGESEEEEVFSCVETSSSGTYVIPGLPTGSYTVAFFSEGPAELYHQAFSESESTPVKVTAPEGDALNVDAVLPALPRRIVSPRVIGTAAVGGTLTCEEGAYGGVPAPTLSVQWLREGEPIEGATSPSYTVQQADAGQQLQCKVTASNLMGSLWVKTFGVPIPVPVPATTSQTAPTSPSSPSGGVLPSITVVPVVTAASNVITAHNRTTVRQKCSGGPCKGTLELLLRVVSHHHASTLVLGTGSFSLQAGASSTVVVHLNAAGRSRLAHDAHRAVAAKLKVSLHGGATTTHSVSAS